MSLEIWKDTRLPLLRVAITSGGDAVDLTGASGVTFSMRHRRSAVLKVSAQTCTVDDAAGGEVSYPWAAADTDTVGSYKGWLTTTVGGKTQDTDEFDIDIVEHAPTAIAVPYPVDDDGTTHIYKGDSYLNADQRALTYQLEVTDAPDLTGLTCTFRIEGLFEKAGTVIGEDGFRVDLTSTETAALTIGTWAFEIEATVSVGNVVTLMRGQIEIIDDLAGP